MINSILNFCQNVHFEFNLFQFILGSVVLVLIIAILLIFIKILYSIRKAKIIDERVRETRTRIARVLTEIEEYNESISEAEETSTKMKTLEEEVQSNEKVAAEIPMGKKTRAMSMDQRWAEFDKKRARTNTA